MPVTDFTFDGGDVGVLLIHGLTGTPMEMRPLAKGLNRAGYTVHAVRLAGHCGSNDDLVRTTWRDWYGSVVDAVDRLRPQVRHLFVGGLSMGALLALKVAADRPADVDGVVSYGATFFYDGWAIPRIARLTFLLPLVIALGIGRRRSFLECPPYGLKDERIREHVAGAMLAGDSAAAGLAGNPWPSLAQMHRLSGVVRRQLREVECRCLVVHAVEDDIASVRNAQIVQRQVRAPVETLWLEDSYHMVTLDRERQAVIDRSADFFARVASGAPAVARHRK